MSFLVQDFLEKTRCAKSIDELNALFENVIKSIGFTDWAYVLEESGQEEQGPLILGNYPEKWVDHYIASRYDEIDPILNEGVKEVMPYQWDDLLKTLDLTPKQAEFFHEAGDFGLGDGLGIPIHSPTGGYGSVSMVSQNNSKELSLQLKDIKDILHIISLVYHQSAKEFIAEEPLIKVSLTPREKECLLWTAKGKTAWEASQILSISERTVVFHIENAKVKLNATSRQHAVVKAIMYKIINP